MNLNPIFGDYILLIKKNEPKKAQCVAQEKGILFFFPVNNNQQNELTTFQQNEFELYLTEWMTATTKKRE